MICHPNFRLINKIVEISRCDRDLATAVPLRCFLELGISGGIVAGSPGKGGVGIFAPPLDNANATGLPFDSLGAVERNADGRTIPGDWLYDVGLSG